MTGLKVVALVSGGKDSLFSLLHCLCHGHSVVALANLHPAHGSVQDVDSYMYQTVGHNILNSIASALELPLYRQRITGSAVSSAKTYEKPEEDRATDEVEDMLELLSAVLAQHPEVNAISSGAILSDYQRTRVESVASRLGLTSLSYLWQYPFLAPYKEHQLLLDMAAVGQDSRIIKVATGSLGEADLWSNVASPVMIRRLQKAAHRFSTPGDGSILGEGGEYETLTIDGPAPLWKSRIQIEEEDLSMVAEPGGTATVLVSEAGLADKSTPRSSIPALRLPPLFDDNFLQLRQSLLSVENTPRDLGSLTCSLSHPIHANSSRTASHDFVHLANLTGDGATVADQMRGIMHSIIHIHNIDPVHIHHATILLREMSSFASVNPVYATLFSRPNPPSRVTISVGRSLPPNVQVSVSLLLSPSAHREALHVQSRSYWAPANIGPYSQAVAAGLQPRMTSLKIASEDADNNDQYRTSRIVHIAGQIPLEPASMELHNPSGSVEEVALQQTLLSAQHLWRVGQIMNVNCFLGGIAYIAGDSTGDSARTYADVASRVWQGLHAADEKAGEGEEGCGEEDEDEDVDVWDLKHGVTIAGEATASTYRDAVQRGERMPFFAVEVEGLPRGAPVEWSAVGYGRAGARFVNRDKDGGGRHWEISAQGDGAVDGEVVAGWIVVGAAEDPEGQWERALEDIKLVCQGGSWTLHTVLQPSEDVVNATGAMVVPCRRVWDERGKDVAAVISYLILD